ncbi:uncharacterized protein CTHT_0054010 [Thermochaetoides thermophila DSM 1495]|uniref:DUF7727 domain-containing protein n=1 Tax=Chaetomium thermophilum (strain DSM 1495 / CBS 144.50 / IMI 039719) TaxID=759272 RepID=G0SBL5_CHATD|nr:hypothetical protein CTHT_0054010 [Thermochaetoides thermophila DSM 1495]EGS18791.1 hypothetical protein CTHT_0054010 [Thermochaetoides thermophila DSM 1495]
MGRLIKNHWARLVVLSSAAYQVTAAVHAFFWPKILWDFLTKTLDPAVRPIPVLQIINLIMGLLLLAWEWPLSFIAGSSIHRSLEARLAFLPLAALASSLLYQGANAAIYYVIGMAVYFWAYSEGEMICAKPWTLPQRAPRGGGSRV